MAEIINLRLARKQADRAKARQKGDENAARFGRSTAQKSKEAHEAETSRRHLDGHLRHPDKAPPKD